MTIESHPDIMIDPGMMGGVPVIRGTRMPVYIILENIACSRTFEQIIEDYPSLTREGIKAALMFAADLSGEVELVDGQLQVVQRHADTSR
ncbi:MAG: DUF433 domain-containing protein [Phycisphaerae bacterium]